MTKLMTMRATVAALAMALMSAPGMAGAAEPLGGPSAQPPVMMPSGDLSLLDAALEQCVATHFYESDKEVMANAYAYSYQASPLVARHIHYTDAEIAAIKTQVVNLVVRLITKDCNAQVLDYGQAQAFQAGNAIVRFVGKYGMTSILSDPRFGDRMSSLVEKIDEKKIELHFTH